MIILPTQLALLIVTLLVYLVLRAVRGKKFAGIVLGKMIFFFPRMKLFRKKVLVISIFLLFAAKAYLVVPK